MPSQSPSSSPAAAMTPRLFCKGCGYALVGLQSTQCPECGRGFDLGDAGTFATRPPRRALWRWGRRVLALLLLLLLIAGAGVGWLWWGWHAEQPTIARLRGLQQQFTVAPIGPQRLRGVLGERFGYLAERVAWVELDGLTAADTEALYLRSLSQIQRLVLDQREVSPSTLNRLGGLQKLQTLWLSALQIEKPDLAFLETLPALSDLRLWAALVDQAGLEHIGRLKHLKFLGLYQAGLTDADLKPLQGLSALEYLSLRGNPVTDAGLAHLQGLKSLRLLSLDFRLLGSPGAAQLKQAIPGLQILPY